MKVIVVDDEELARLRLKDMLHYIENITIIGEADNGQDAIEIIQSLNPDLVFLDIEMPELSGIDVAKKVNGLCEIIFVTAYDSYAIQAFEENAVAYLLKPVNQEKLISSIDRVRKILSQNENIIRKSLDFFHSKVGSRIKFIAYKDVYYISSKDKYTFIYYKKSHYIIDDTLNELEKSLPSEFLRIHRSIMINVNMIDSIERIGKGKFEFKLLNSSELMSSSSYLSDIKTKLDI